MQGKTWGDVVGRSACAGLVWLLLFFAGTANAQELARSFNNPLLDAFGGPLRIADLEVHYPHDDAFARGLDRASTRYVAEHFSEEQQQSFTALAEARGNAPEEAAERFSEYLAETDLRGRLPAAQGEGRALRLSIVVDEVRFRGLIVSAIAPGFPYKDMSFVLTDVATGETFAHGRIRRCASWGEEAEAARRLHNLQFNWSGTDTNFRLMAGMTSALAGCVQHLVEARTFPSGPTEVGRAYTGSPFFLSVPINMREPIYEIGLGPPVEGATPSD